MKKLEIKYSLVHLEVEARMKIAELAATLMNTFYATCGGGTMEQYMSIYTELTNTILEPLEDMKNNVVSQMSEESTSLNDSSL